MICLMNDESMIVLYDERCADYVSPGHPERPERVTMTAKRLKKQSRLSLEWRLPVAASEEAIRLAHSALHIKNLRKKMIKAGCADYIKTVYGVGYKFHIE